MPLFDHFHILAPFYERLIHPPQEVDWPMRLHLEGQPGILLDAGGGTGRVTQQLIGANHDLVVFDETFAMLREAKRKGGLLPALGVTERLPFGEFAFDRILMVDVFHHLENQPQAINELWRVLKPGGRLVIEEPDIDQPAVKWIALGEKLLFMRSHFWKPQAIADLFSGQPCQVTIERAHGNAWITIDRAPLV